MATPVRDPLADLELHRQRLQDNIDKLRKSLRHWQTWEAEYEGLKEEILALPTDASFHDLARVATDFDGDLVTAKEVHELLGLPKAVQRPPKQVADLLSKRIDYVQRNVDAIKGQIQTAEHKLDGVAILTKPDIHNDEGLPVTDIHEELDDDGNVISSTVSHPDDAQPQILDALKKAGLKQNSLSTPEQSADASTDDALSAQEKSITPTSSGLPRQSTQANPNASNLPRAGTKSVTQALNPPAVANPPLQKHASNEPVQSTASNLARGSFLDGDRVIELDQEDNLVSAFENPTIEDSPEDAALRRQMQAYSMAEVGSIVAQLDVEEGEDQDSSADEDDESLYSDTQDLQILSQLSGNDANSDYSDDNDTEDDHGMNFGGRLSDAYIQQMLDLEQKLNARVIQNIGPGEAVSDEHKVASTARRLVVNREKPKEAGKTPKEKSVRFAEKLDVAQDAQHDSKSERSASADQQQPPPVAMSVVERASPSETSRTGQPPKASRFKQLRQQNEATNTSNVDIADMPAQSISSNNPLANTIVERSTESNRSPPKDLEPSILRQQVNTEYYRQRNNIIQKQGGFKRDKLEDDHEPDDDHNPGRNKKVSLFKAARVQTEGAW